jgi:two-component system response regulator HupR/HoxA
VGRRVLLVDHDPISLQRLSRSLDDEWAVTTAAGPNQAQILLDAFEYQALIAAHGTAGQEGIELLEWVRARHPKVKRLLTTDREPATLAPHLLSGLIQKFLARPVDRDELRTALGGKEDG